MNDTKKIKLNFVPSALARAHSAAALLCRLLATSAPSRLITCCCWRPQRCVVPSVIISASALLSVINFNSEK